MILVGLANVPDPLQRLLVANVAAQRVTRIRRIHDHPARPQHLGGLPDEALLRRDRMQFQIDAHEFRYDTRMNQVLELAPLLAFFLAYLMGGLYWATGVLMAASVILVFAYRQRNGNFKDLHVMTAVLVVILGSATLLLHDKRFIQWKPTVLYGLLAAALLISNVAGRRPWIQRLFESVVPEAIAVSPRGWRYLTALWAAWFALAAAANMYVVTNFSEIFWVHFHTYGISIATMIFMIPQIFWLNSRTREATPGVATPGVATPGQTHTDP